MLVKLSEYADMLNVSYITVYRWFKDGRLFDSAFQTESGTILVEVPDKPSITENNNAAISMILKKVIECKMNNIQIEDFASWILSTFSLKLHEANNFPKYHKVKPKSEDIQNYYKKFIPNNDDLKQKKQELQKSDDGNKIIISSDDYIDAHNSSINTNEIVQQDVVDLLSKYSDDYTEKLGDFVSSQIESIKTLDPIEAANVLKNAINKFKDSENIESSTELQNDQKTFDAVNGKGFIKRVSKKK